MRVRGQSISQKFSFVAVFFLNAFILIQNARFDPDAHHDGLVFAGAVASSESMVPNRDFFAQYGPLTPYLQGLFLDLTSNSLFNLRVLMALLLALNGLAVFYLISRIRGLTIAFFTQLIWVLELAARIPWPSILSTSILLLALIILIETKNAQMRVTSMNSRIYSAGFLLGATPFIRIHNLILAFGLIFLLMVVRRAVFFRKLLASALLGISIGLLLLASFGSLFDFIRECVIWPLNRYASPDLTKSYLVGLLWFPIISISVLFYFHFFSKRTKEPAYFGRRIVFVLLWVLISLGLLIPRNGYLSLRNPKIVYVDFTHNFLHFVGFLSASITALFIILTLLRSLRDDLDLLAALFGLSGLSQLYPLYDQVHLWFVTPVLIACVLIFTRNMDLERYNIHALLKSLVPFIVILCLFAVNDWSKPREKYTSQILSGLYGTQASKESLDSNLSLLLNHSGSNQVYFKCPNGIYSVFDGTFRSAISDYVDWSPGFKDVKLDGLVFVCDVPVRQFDEYQTRYNLIKQYRYSLNQDEYFSALFKVK